MAHVAKYEAAKMRQGPADEDLVCLLDDLRPWQDEAAVDRALCGYVDRQPSRVVMRDTNPFGVESDRAVGWPAIWDCSEIADELRLLGRAEVSARPHCRASFTPEVAANVVAFMLMNVAAGRGVTDYGMPLNIEGVPKRTKRRYVAQFGKDAEWKWLQRHVQYDLDLAALMRAGRSEAAARAWLRRNPGRRASEAKPVRTRRATPGQAMSPQ